MENSRTVIVGNKNNTTKQIDESKLKSILSKIGIGAAGLTGAALLSSPVTKLIDAVTDEYGGKGLPDPVIVIHDQAPAATQATDEMSLKDAFLVSREEVGPGGTFVHHNKTYSTYTKEEENAMTDEHKHDFVVSTNNVHVETPQISANEIEIIPVDNTQGNETTENQQHEVINHKEPLDEMLAGNTTPATPTTEPATQHTQTDVVSNSVEPLDEMLAGNTTPTAPATEPAIQHTHTDVAVNTTEPLDEMLADNTAPATPTTEPATQHTQTDIVSNSVEPLDEMLAGNTTPTAPTTESANQHAQADVAVNATEPLDEMLAGNTTIQATAPTTNTATPLEQMPDENDGKLQLIGENWVANEADGSKAHVMYYTQDNQTIIKIDQNNDGVFDTVFSTKPDGTVHIQTSNGEETYLTNQELDKVLFIENKEDVFDIKSRHTFIMIDTDGDGKTDSFLTSNSDGKVHVSNKGNATLILDDVAQLVDAKDHIHHATPVSEQLLGQNDDAHQHHFNDMTHHVVDDNSHNNSDFNVSTTDNF